MNEKKETFENIFIYLKNKYKFNPKIFIGGLNVIFEYHKYKKFKKYFPDVTFIDVFSITVKIFGET